jgi:hypothetical protein
MNPRPTPDIRNPWWPLPPDYDQLTRLGQKQARLAVLLDQDSPESLVIAWELFRNLYLKPRGEAFYRGGFSPSPDFHYQGIYDIGEHARNALAAPRGFGKSVVFGLELPLFLLLTRTFFDIILCLSTDKLVEARFDKIIEELTGNPAIINDFGHQKPKRGDAIWNHHHLHCNNGSVLEGFSITGRKRGARPKLFILDDPEYDPDARDGAATSRLLHEKFEMYLFRQILPMLEKGSGIFWIGTMINRRSFLFNACNGDDERFGVWNRRVLQAVSTDPEHPSRNKLLWAEKWDEKFLAARKREVGISAFPAEYLNNPISGQEHILTIDPILNEYTISGLPAPSPGAPDKSYSVGTPCVVSGSELLSGDYTVSYHQKAARSMDSLLEIDLAKDIKVQHKTTKELFGSMYRIATVDLARGLTTRHDFSCIAVMGFDRSNCLWVLDMWMGRVREAQLLAQIYKMGYAWRVKVVGIESVSMQMSVVDSATEYFGNKELTSGWAPKVMPVKYPANVSKSDRIEALEVRFLNGRIKYPAHLKEKWPMDMLYEQTEKFTSDLALLQFDDAIDTVAMSQYVVHSKGARGPAADAGELTLAERITRNIPVVPGIPLLSGVRMQDIDTEVLEALIDKSMKKKYNAGKHSRDYKIRRPYVKR